ncbi:mechanosensitive ion channel domain-containing protein [Perlabentimonas gracilis]|uniref:mechanosensitive ion channel domain-containing protein n=1 Tax=Perlabentimonas gracilis TaxID=2715279 RepID=UPI00140A80F9|nr:mechanosensitive ion channel domain-containing protein [Perlabentimonas gracilis]NHB67492.1 mechanosensitive ion channel [Perlabentimonas gracilis]
MTVYYLAFAIGIFVVLRYLSKVLGTVSYSRAVYRVLARIFPVVELIIWLAFGLWVINQLFDDLPYYPLLVSAVAIGIVLIFGWYFLRDFISGIILKAEMPLEKNQHIGVHNNQGLLRRVGYRSIEIETHKGELVKIPYSQLASGSIHLLNKNDSLQSYEMKLPVSTSIPMQEARDMITRSLLLLPWVAVSKEPSIKVVDKTATQNVFSISYYTTSSSYASNVNEHLVRQFEEVTS